MTGRDRRAGFVHEYPPRTYLRPRSIAIVRHRHPVREETILGRNKMHHPIAPPDAVCAALLIRPGAFSQVAPNPDNPNAVVGDALAPRPYGEPINLETAKK